MEYATGSGGGRGELWPLDAGEKLEATMEVALLKLLRKNGVMASSSDPAEKVVVDQSFSSSTAKVMVKQCVQTELSGEVVTLEKSKNKISD